MSAQFLFLCIGGEACGLGHGQSERFILCHIITEEHGQDLCLQNEETKMLMGGGAARL